jgi:dGTPase
MVGDLVEETRRRLAEAKPESVADIRALGRPIVGFSDELRASERPLRRFLWDHMYRHYKVNRMISRAKRVIAELFETFMADPSVLPTDWARRCAGADKHATARIVCDYVAGMTDSYALDEHRKLTGAQLAP